MNDFPKDPLDSGIRPMEESDLTQVHAIECDSQQHPWTLEHFKAELENPVADTDVFILHGEIAGFLCSWLIAGELQIQNLATSRPFRRRGVAKQLLEHVLDRSCERGMEIAWLEVRADNPAAVSLYRAWGFSVSARRPGYYKDGVDALIMRRSFTNASR